MKNSPKLENRKARLHFLEAQKLNELCPFGNTASATKAAIEHLGYVQIDTINVIERCHHHILYNRIPSYQLDHLKIAQSVQKSVFEYWTHALAYVPKRDYSFFMRDMKSWKAEPSSFYGKIEKNEVTRVLKMIRNEGALTIRDISDEHLVEKNHPWASRKPSKKILQYCFYSGDLVISERIGMLKKYELASRHFNWKVKPKAATEKEIHAYLLERALRTQAFVSLDSICYLEPSLKSKMKKLIDTEVKAQRLIPVQVEGSGSIQHWMKPETFDSKPKLKTELCHLLSPFDPLVIQRKRLHQVFQYEHRFEAYVPKEKRKYGYFALPALIGTEIVAAIDLKTDRQNKKLLIQKWTWLPKAKSNERKKQLEEALDRFERFQLAEIRSEK